MPDHNAAPLRPGTFVLPTTPPAVISSATEQTRPDISSRFPGFAVAFDIDHSYSPVPWNENSATFQDRIRNQQVAVYEVFDLFRKVARAKDVAITGVRVLGLIRSENDGWGQMNSRYATAGDSLDTPAMLVDQATYGKLVPEALKDFEKLVEGNYDRRIRDVRLRVVVTTMDNDNNNRTTYLIPAGPISDEVRILDEENLANSLEYRGARSYTASDLRSALQRGDTAVEALGLGVAASAHIGVNKSFVQAQVDLRKPELVQTFNSFKQIARSQGTNITKLRVTALARREDGDFSVLGVTPLPYRNDSDLQRAIEYFREHAEGELDQDQKFTDIKLRLIAEGNDGKGKAFSVYLVPDEPRSVDQRLVDEHIAADFGATKLYTLSEILLQKPGTEVRRSL